MPTLLLPFAAGNVSSSAEGPTYYGSLGPFIDHMNNASYSTMTSNTSSMRSSKRPKATLEYWQERCLKTEIGIIKASQLVAHGLMIKESEPMSLPDAQIGAVFSKVTGLLRGGKIELGKWSPVATLETLLTYVRF
jgi:hypothetical protein